MILDEPMNNTTTNKAADNIRALSVAMVEKAKAGHPGGSMGGADFVNILYSEYLNFDPDKPEWFFRDRFFLDPGQLSPMLYSVLSFFDFYSIEDLKNFRQWGSVTPGHPEKDFKRGIENTSGPLGQGHAMALGAAIAERYLANRFGEWTSHTIFSYLSDGSIQEEISQGVGRIAGCLGLSNLVMFFDANEVQLSTKTTETTTEDTAKKYEAWGWKTITIDGNDPDQIRKALEEAIEEKERPVLIVGNTVMGKGLITTDGSSFEGEVSTHGQPVSKAGASAEDTLKKMGADPENPFEIFEETKKLYVKAREKKRAYVEKKKKLEKEFEKNHPEQARQLSEIRQGLIPDIDYAAIEYPENAATRNTSGNVLSTFAEKLNNMIVASADLSNSDKTAGFLKHSKALTHHDFSGGFLNAGVSELTMAEIANGLALHGAIIPVTGTFLVFSDFMKPAIRLAALMELPVKYVFSHDAFRVGEDGPTHQPVEQEAQLRLLEKVRNHSGNRSMLVLRPADGAETKVAWKMAMENTETPTVLILSRQKIRDIAPMQEDRFREALEARRGAYVVKNCQGTPDVVLVGNGLEVSTILEGEKILTEKHSLKVRVVSVPSVYLFCDQPKEYREKVLPYGVPVWGMTAGLPNTLEQLAGPKGRVYGLDHFGYSAPYNVLDEKFGYTAENVAHQVQQYLKEFEE